MKRFLLICLSALCAASCEIPFEIQQEGEPQIYMQALLGNSPGFMIRYFAASPISADKASIGPIEAEVRINGEPAGAQYHYPDQSQFLIAFPLDEEAPKEGDEITVTLRAENMKEVSGSTRWLSAPDITLVEAKNIVMDTTEVTQVSITLAEAPENEDFFGISIVGSYYFSVNEGSPARFIYPVTPGRLLSVEESAGFDLEDFMQVSYNQGLIGFFSNAEPNYITLLSRKQFDGAVYSFYLNSFDSNLLSDFRDRFPSGDTGIAGGGIVSGGIGQGQTTTPPTYSIRFYRLSEETYRFAKANYQSNFDFLSNMGLTPANFTWTNVKNGLGVVGGLYDYNTNIVIQTSDGEPKVFY
ncbi:MAG: DUF4249 family protein [Bacteroidales bacterium]|nr:DUF4249 family protein [Bacteroidales bacterium]